MRIFRDARKSWGDFSGPGRIGANKIKGLLRRIGYHLQGGLIFRQARPA
jgi:hypothetical protein